MSIDAELAAIHAYQAKHAECDIQQHPWQHVFAAGFEAGAAEQAAEIERLRDVYERTTQRIEVAVNATIEQKNAEIERLKGQIAEFRYNYNLSEEQYTAEAKHSIRLETALRDIVQVIDHEQPLGNGHRLRELARVALEGRPSRDTLVDEQAAEIERLRTALREAKGLLFATQHPTMDGSERQAIKNFLARPFGEEPSRDTLVDEGIAPPSSRRPPE